MNITSQQEQKLKEILSQEELEVLETCKKEGRTFDFFTELHCFIVDRFVNDEPTDKSTELEFLFDEIASNN